MLVKSLGECDAMFFERRFLPNQGILGCSVCGAISTYSVAYLWFCLLVADFEAFEHALQSTVKTIFPYSAINAWDIFEKHESHSNAKGRHLSI